MKTKILQVIGCCILLLWTGCDTKDDVSDMSSDKIRLTMNVAANFSVSTRTETALPEKEKIKTLRVIIIDGEGKVEYNDLIEQESGVEQISNRTFQVSKNNNKKIYLLANVEGLSDLDPANNDGLEERIKQNISITSEYLSKTEYLPMSSCYEFRVEDENKDCGTLYVAYATTKFTFTIKNEMPDSKKLGVSGLTINQIADKSYLYPIVKNTEGKEDKFWLEKLENGEIIRSYEIPDMAEHAPYDTGIEERIVIENGHEYSFPAVYVPESKYIVDGKQSYSLSINLGSGNDETNDRIRDLQISSNNKPLNSLFRNTHVNITIVVKNLNEIEIIHGIYGMINPWEDNDPVSGSIEEKK